MQTADRFDFESKLSPKVALTTEVANKRSKKLIRYAFCMGLCSLGYQYQSPIAASHSVENSDDDPEVTVSSDSKFPSQAFSALDGCTVVHDIFRNA